MNYRRLIVAVGLALCLGGITRRLVAAELSPSAALPPPATVRGAVYIPIDAYNAPQMWRHFSLAETRRDFSYAQSIHVNTLRIWASYEFWQLQPAQFQAELDQLLAAAHDDGIRVLLSLFEEDGVPPTPEHMWDTNPATAFDIQSPGFAITGAKDRQAWEKPRAFLEWFMQHYRNDSRLIAIEVMNEPNGVEVPFAKAMLRTAKAMQGSVALTIGSDSLVHALPYIPLGLDLIEYHDNFPQRLDAFEAGLTNALAVGRQHNLPVWLTEWQRLRPSGTGFDRQKITAAERFPDFASLAPIVHKYPVGNFFWSLMVKRAYLPPQRAHGTVNGLFWADGAVYSLADARAIAQDPALKLPERAALPPGYLDYLRPPAAPQP